MAQNFKSKAFWVELSIIISLSAIGTTLGVLLSQNKVNTNLNQSSGDSSTTYTYTDQYGDWEWYINDQSGGDPTTATIKKFTGTAADVVIPSTITKDGTTYTVTELYDIASDRGGVFYGARSTLKSITIPNTITSIGGGSFSWCSGLTSVEIPDSVTSIGQEAFCECYGLTSITIGRGVTSISEAAFSNCEKLLEVINKSSLTITAGSNRVSGNTVDDYLGYYAKQIITDASQSKYQVIDNVMYYIDSTNNEYIAVSSIVSNPTSITINNSCTSIYQTFISGCTSLTSLSIGSNVTCINWSAFSGCTGLTSVYFLHDYTSGVQASSSSSPNYIGSYAFTSGNSNVTYYFINQASRDNAYNLSNRSNYFTGSNFEVMTPQFNVEVNNNDWGSITGNTNLAIGDSTTLTATPNTGYGFKYWLKDGYQFDNNTSNVLTTTFTEYIVTYTAVFDVAQQKTLTVDSLTPTLGSVSGGGTHYEDEQVTLTATPNTGAKFFYWLKNGQVFAGSLSNPLVITVTEDATYTVVFAPADYNPQIRSPNSVILEYEYQGTETVNPEVCGRLTTYCYGDFDNKTTVRVEAIATTGYRFVGWKINGETTISSKYTTTTADILLTDIPNSKIIIAVFGSIDPLTFANKNLGSIRINNDFSGSVDSATGGSPGYTYAITSASSTYPTGLVLSSAGQFSGKPTTSGTYIFVVTATDSAGHIVSANYTLEVLEMVCLTSETLIWVDNGTTDGILKQISQISAGERVFSYNETTGEIESNEVIETYHRTTQDSKKLVHIQFEGNETINCTLEHPFYLSNGQLIDAEELKSGDIIKTASGTITVQSVIVEDNIVIDVYNLQVENNHNYFISSQKILTHNIVCGSG